MDILFTNKTKNSKKIYDEFLVFHHKTFKLKFWFKTTIVTILLIYILVINLMNNTFMTRLVAICIFLSLIIYLFFKVFKPIKDVEKDYKSSTIQKEEFQIYNFYEKHMTIQKLNISLKDTNEVENAINVNEPNSQIITKKYSNLYKIYETKNFYYFYLNFYRVYIIDKQTFINSSANDFSNYFNKKLRFIKKD